MQTMEVKDQLDYGMSGATSDNETKISTAIGSLKISSSYKDVEGNNGSNPSVDESQSGKLKDGGKKDKKHKKRQNKNLTPEEINELKAIRRLKKESQQKINSEESNFITRDFLSLPMKQNTNGFIFTMMTYNCLAQALIRRRLFPTSGNALKWRIRSETLLKEFKHYNSDVMCLQEIDHVQYKQFWNIEFQKLGYSSQMHRFHSSAHGVVIAWRKSMFELADYMLIDYDKEKSGVIKPMKATNNVGLAVALKFSKEVLRSHPHTTKSGILVGTSHLFWHPFGTYERTRQTYVLLRKMKEFMHRVNVFGNNTSAKNTSWYSFICGDFNSQPFDSPYLSMVSKPVAYHGRARTVITCSAGYNFSQSIDEGSDEENKEEEKQPATPTPEYYNGTEREFSLVSEMEKLHNSIDLRAISLYSVGYRYVDAENAGLDNDRGEPEISNWAHTWKGLLDYIMCLTDWDFSDHTKLDTLDQLEQTTNVKILGLLKMPAAKDMPEHGLPHLGEYPSDHLCMMTRLELDM
ncbi:HDL454Wp [Eremothecium sinecaudum]|uniref:HDL454Wp n=1 Tax=Eremothecium sinecaudum TaxID=45286 RepID=A0A0X8HRU0_9SACH|nr:HDL454Wp [Eremothecium sinecaudum]AMD20290.1 HDL454Wp [Eremothecium sinecaudum]